MGPDLRIDWDEVCANPDDFEKLVKLLLQRLHPDGQAIDGVGGDEGRDYELRSADRLVLWEAKSFTGRLRRRNPNRRSQVEESLKSAARHQPDAWHLVVPIDADTRERAWFDGLRAEYPFVGKWRGITWLESKLADDRNADLVRYATQNKLLEYVRTYNLEVQALAGHTRALIERTIELDRLAEEVNPYWRPTTLRLPDGTRVGSIEAKRDDAQEKAPIIFDFGVNIPEATEHDAVREAWKANLELGTGATLSREYITQFDVSGPPDLGLPTSGDIPDLVKFVAVPDTDVADVPALTLGAYEPGKAHPIASLTFHVDHRFGGSAGVRLIAFDPARTVEMKADIRKETVKLNLRAVDAPLATPGAILPSMRFCQAVVPPNRLVLTAGVDKQICEDSTIDRPFLDEPPEPELVQYVEDLSVLQERLRSPFPMPHPASRREAFEARRLRRLIDGEAVDWLQGPLTVTIVRDCVDEFVAQFADFSEGWLRASYDDMEATFGGHSLHTGPVWMLAQVRIDVSAIRYDPDDRTPTVTFEVLGNGWVSARWGVPEDEGEDEIVAPTAGGGGRVALRPSVPPGIAS